MYNVDLTKAWDVTASPLQQFMAGQAHQDSLNKADQEQMKSALANYLSGATMQNDISKSDFEGEKYRLMNNPTYLDAMLRGDIGGFQSKEATGRFDKDTVDAKIKHQLAKYGSEGKEYEGKGIYFDEQNDALRRIRGGEQPPAQIGFPMAPNPVAEAQATIGERPAAQWGGEGLSVPKPLPILKNEAAMRQFMGNDPAFGYKSYDIAEIDKEIARTKDPKVLAILQAERQKMVAALAGGQSTQEAPQLPVGGQQSTQPAPVLSNMAKPSGTPWSDAMSPQSRLGQMAAVLGTSPEYAKSAALAEGKNKEKEDAQAAKIAAMERGFDIRAQTADQDRARNLAKQHSDYATKLSGVVAKGNEKELETLVLQELINNGKTPTESEKREAIQQYKKEIEKQIEYHKGASKHYEQFTGLPVYRPPEATPTPQPSGSVIKYNSKGERIK